MGLRLLRGKVIFFDLLITCLSPRKDHETFWMAEVAFLVRGLCGPKEASLLVPKAHLLNLTSARVRIRILLDVQSFLLVPRFVLYFALMKTNSFGSP